MLSTLITSKARVELITWFITHPAERFYYRQLIDILNASKQSIQNELARLESAGLLSSQKEGNIRFFWVNQDFILYPEIKSMILKTVGVGDELRKSLSKIGEIKSAFIYGSVANNREDARSDIDVMVIGDVTVVAVHEAIMKVEKHLGREVNYTIFSPGEWKKKMNNKTAFVRGVARGEKIFLIGTEDELRKSS
ncbi:MAG: nucleotidyltransferase domain-containing protein [Actinobacteria bacterium]|nr:nucleotidyltransferase domain-containing protein [Actinomycetota bacterium]